MPKAYSYIRFSTPEQAKGDSLRRQTAAAEKWCAERGLKLDQSLRDLGVSAHKGANVEVGSALGSFLALVKEKKIEKGSYLIVESLDRLSRENIVDALPRFMDLIKSGIKIVTLTDNQEYSESSIKDAWYQLIISLTVMARAYEESKTKGMRIGASWARKREKARSGNHKMTARAPEWLSLEKGSYHLREDRVAIVKRVFSETIEGYGRRTIANRLNLEHIPAFRGENGWYQSSIAKILNSRAVFGEFQPGEGSHKNRDHRPSGDPIQNYYPSIVDENTFWQAQNAMKSRLMSGGRKGHGVAHLLTGLVKCNCGASMIIVNKGPLPKGGVYFECSYAQRKMGCDNTLRWRVDAIERRLLRGLSYIDADAVLRGETPKSEIDKVSLLEAKLAAEEKRLKNVLRVVETDDDDDLAASRYKALRLSVRSIKSDLATAKKELAAVSADPGLKVRLSEAIDMSAAMEAAEGQQRTEIRTRLAEQLRQIVRKIVFHHEIGVTAFLKERPGLADADVPFAYGNTSAHRWQMYLDDDGDPHGPPPWFMQDEGDDLPRPTLKMKSARRS